MLNPPVYPGPEVVDVDNSDELKFDRDRNDVSFCEICEIFRFNGDFGGGGLSSLSSRTRFVAAAEFGRRDDLGGVALRIGWDAEARGLLKCPTLRL